MSLLGQLKSRNVFRVGMAYIVAAWVLIQVADVVLTRFGVEPWGIKFIVFLCLIGFPFALWLSWTFALTPEGLRLERYVDREDQVDDVRGKRLDFIIIALLAAVVGLEALERFVPLPESEELAAVTAEPAPDPSESSAATGNPAADPREPVEVLENSIAVLPFDNLSVEPGQEYFADGLADELLNALTRVDGLNVASRTSSFAFKGDQRSAQDIARALRVAYVIEGSVRKSGDRLRITTQLVDTESGGVLWSESYDREMTDIFAVQGEIANSIVSSLQAELDSTLQSVAIDSATASFDAYDLYLRGRELFIARENLPDSWDLLTRATALDPEFARAWETLAAVHSVANSWFPGDGIDHDALALASANRALELDSALSMPHAVIGMKYYVTGTGYAGAIDRLDTAIENDPRNATAHLWRGITVGELGYLDHALEDFDACLAIDPAYLNCQQWRAEALLGLGRVQEAIAQFEATLPFNFHSASDAFVSYYVRTGQMTRAHLVASLAMRLQFAPIKDWIAAIEDPATRPTAIARFEEWGQDHNLGICDMDMVAVALGREDCYTEPANVRMMWQPDTAAYRQTPAFKAWINENAMAFWQEWGFPPQCRDLGDGEFECD